MRSPAGRDRPLPASSDMTSSGTQLVRESEMDVREAQLNDPLEEYQRRRRKREETALRLTRLHRRIANARIAVFLLAAGLTWLAYRLEWISGIWVGVSLVAFLTLVIWHERVTQAKSRARNAI